MIKWTEKMIETLKVSKNLSEFARDNRISVSSARNKRNELFPPAKPVVEQVSEQTSSEADIGVLDGLATLYIPSIISDVNKLVEFGVANYIQDIANNICVEDNKLSDVLHYIEIKGDEISDEEKLKIFKEIQIIRHNRRVYKNESELFTKTKGNANGFVNFIKHLWEIDKRAGNKLYITRVMKSVFGEHIIKDGHEYLLDRVDSNVITAVDRKMDIKRVQEILADFRKSQRMKNEIVAIDKLRNCWKSVFYNDTETFIKETVKIAKEKANRFAIENEITLDSSIEYVFNQHTLPEAIYEMRKGDKKYALKEDK